MNSCWPSVITRKYWNHKMSIIAYKWYENYHAPVVWNIYQRVAIVCWEMLYNHYIDIIVTSEWTRWRLKSPAWRLFNRPRRCRSKKTLKLRVTGLCVGNSPGTGEFPTEMASNAENVSIWWRKRHQVRAIDKCGNGSNLVAPNSWYDSSKQICISIISRHWDGASKWTPSLWHKREAFILYSQYHVS